MPPAAPGAVQFSAAAAQLNSSISSIVQSRASPYKEGAMKNIARAGRVDALAPESQGKVGTAAVPCEHAEPAEQ